MSTTKLIPPCEFHSCVRKLRSFFESRDFVEVHPQSVQTILAACEDPSTISTYNYGGQVWPLPQTGQMQLEHVLLENPDFKGCFCVSTSFRNEPNPVPGRHDKIFPMFEFEMHGGMDELIQMEKDLLEHLGFPKREKDIEGKEVYPEDDYRNIAKRYDTIELEHEHEEQLEKDHGEVYFIKNFPFYTSPFWNMKADFEKDEAKKVDVIIHGIETIGSAERSCNPKEMRYLYNKISDGQYADILHSKFTEERVQKELNHFLEYDFIPRSGGGIGVTRMIRAMKLSNLI